MTSDKIRSRNTTRKVDQITVVWIVICG